MNENINLVEILKDCPKGTKLYSTTYGEVTFSHIKEYSAFPIVLRVNEDCYPTVTNDGRHSITFEGECTLFPSKDQRDWSKFTATWYKNDKFDPKTLQPFDKVLVFKVDKKQWVCSLFSHLMVIDGVYYAWVTAGWRYNFCIPYTNDTKHLVGTNNNAPEYYRYWED